MKLSTKLDASINVIEDIRAGRRDIGTPEVIVAESTFRLGNRAKQIDDLLRRETIPVVFVDASSNVWVLTAGRSGIVAYESNDDQPLDEEQGKTVQKVIDGLHELLNVKKPKKVSKEKDVPTDFVDEPEWPEDASVET